MGNLNFLVAVNLSTKALDIAVLKWAFSRKILMSHEELEKYNKEKINYFAGYLFPEISTGKLEWIMKMFLCLFVLDDQMDKAPRSESRILIWALRTGNSSNFQAPFSHLYNAFAELNQTLPGKDNLHWKPVWDGHWSAFLKGLEWELDNKYFGKIPDLAEYKYYRPHLSGVFLALHFLKLDFEFVPSCASELLENKIARWICLSNDLISADKEEKTGDFHNELFLLSRISSKREAAKHMEKEISTLYWHIQHLQFEVVNKLPEYCDWVESLSLLMGGCAFWSNEVTIRYSTYLNGVSQ